MSPTAERAFAGRPGFEVASAGLNAEEETPVRSELLEWSDVIFAMERTHPNKLSKKFRAHLKGKRIICLDRSELIQPQPRPRDWLLCQRSGKPSTG